MSMPASLLALFGLTALNWTIHFYTHVVTYRLFGLIANVAGGAGFVRYHQAYERRLPWSIYAPWSALMLASLAYLVVTWSLAAVILLLLNASIAIVSFVLAVPIHRRVDDRSELTARDAEALLSANLIRLLAATLSLALVATLAFEAFVQ